MRRSPPRPSLPSASSSSSTDLSPPPPVDLIAERAKILPQLPESTVVIEKKDASGQVISDYYVIGTAHVSTPSASEVAQVISLVKPDVVFLELCNLRTKLLVSDEKNIMDEYEKELTPAEIITSIKKGQVLALLLGLIFKKVVSQIKVTPGQEFRVGFLEGRKVGARVVLGDRPINITLSRTWAALSIWEKLRLVWMILREPMELKPEDVERFKNHDIITEMIEEATKHFPSLSKTIIDERDMYLAHTLKMCPGRKIVAVVGMGHVRGMRKYWNEHIDIKTLLTVPRSDSWLWWTVKKLFLASFVFGTVWFLGWMAKLLWHLIVR